MYPKPGLRNRRYYLNILIRASVPLLLIPLASALHLFQIGHAVFSVCVVLFCVALSTDTHPLTPILTGIITFCSYLTGSLLFSAPAMDIALASVLVIAALFFGRDIRSRIEREHQKNVHSTECSERLNELNSLLLSANNTEDVMGDLLRFLYRVCGNSVALFEVAVRDDALPRRLRSVPEGVVLFSNDSDAVLAAAHSGTITGVGTNCCAHSSYRCYPVYLNADSHGTLAVVLGTGNDDTDLLSFLDQLVQRGRVALERQRLIDTNQSTELEKQREQMRADFLRAISHDLRSPLAAISGACYALAQTLDMTPQNQQLVADIREESEWLANMVENLLSITRLGTRYPKLNMTTEAVEEIIGEAAYKCRTRFPDIDMEIIVPDQVVILQMDAMLITQVVLNLVENAYKYGNNQNRVALIVACEGEKVYFSVRDYGKGIPPDRLHSVFSGIGNAGGDSHHGLGIGLSICKTIINAHGGEIWAENCMDGGARVVFYLPVEEQ